MWEGTEPMWSTAEGTDSPDVTEIECPVCNVLIDVGQDAITFEEFECHGCNAILEYADGLLLTL